eukprot:Colp12_sorted_trinity150504_noHs@17358
MSARQTPLTCHGHTRPVVDLHYSGITPDGFFLISAGKDSLPMLRNGQTGDWIGTFEGHKGAVWSAQLNTTATRAATGAADFSAKLWDAISGEEIHTFAHKHIVRSVAFSKDGNNLLTNCNDKKMRVFDINKPEQEPQTIECADRLGYYTEDASVVLTCGDVLRKWDLRTGTCTQEVSLGQPITSMELARNSSVVVATHGTTVSCLDGQTLEVIKTFKLDVPVNSASLHPTSDKLVTGGQDFYLHVLDYATGAELEVYKGHHGPVHCVRFAPDGEVYASGSEDGTVRLWQTRVGTEYGLWRLTKEDGPAEPVA